MPSIEGCSRGLCAPGRCEPLFDKRCPWPIRRQSFSAATHLSQEQARGSGTRPIRWALLIHPKCNAIAGISQAEYYTDLEKTVAVCRDYPAWRPHPLPPAVVYATPPLPTRLVALGGELVFCPTISRCCATRPTLSLPPNSRTPACPTLASASLSANVARNRAGRRLAQAGTLSGAGAEGQLPRRQLLRGRVLRGLRARSHGRTG